MSQQEITANKKRRIRLPKLSMENDIRYREPFSYQHFQLFGWICIVTAFVVVMMNVACTVNPQLAPRLFRWKDFLEYVMDLFLCTALMFFLNYKPRRVFTGKARRVFRFFALLPIAYEAACIYFKVMSSLGKIVIPVNCYPLLTVKPPMTFVLFIVLAFFIKIRELRFRRRGGTHEEYQQFLLTKRNSLHFSVFAAAAMLVAGILDVLIITYGADILSGGHGEQGVGVTMALLAAGFGNSTVLSFRTTT